MEWLHLIAAMALIAGIFWLGRAWGKGGDEDGNCGGT